MRSDSEFIEYQRYYSEKNNDKKETNINTDMPKKIQKSKTDDEQQGLDWVKVVDLGTTVNSEQIQEYIDTIKHILEAKEVRLVEWFNNNNGLTVHVLDVLGYVPRMAIKRLSQEVFNLKWLDDARDQGLLQRDGDSKGYPKSEPKPEPEPFEFHSEKVSNIVEENGLWFGDPCYVVPVKRWDSFCGCGSGYFKDQMKVTDEGETFYSWSTAYGDGEYDLKKDGKIVASLGVDAGLLSVVPMRLINKWSNESGFKLGDVGPGYFEGGYILPGSFQGTLIVEKGNMSFDGSSFNITIKTGD